MTTTTSTDTDRRDHAGAPRLHQGPAAARSGTRITDPEWTDRYGYGGIVALRPAARRRATSRPTPAQGDAEAAGVPVPDAIIDGEVIEADPPHRLVHDLADAHGPDDLGRGLHPAHLRARASPTASAG